VANLLACATKNVVMPPAPTTCYSPKLVGETVEDGSRLGVQYRYSGNSTGVVFCTSLVQDRPIVLVSSPVVPIDVKRLKRIR
jgi:hypothetical protein